MQHFELRIADFGLRIKNGGRQLSDRFGGLVLFDNPQSEIRNPQLPHPPTAVCRRNPRVQRPWLTARRTMTQRIWMRNPCAIASGSESRPVKIAAGKYI